jgi:hypothetical protein
MNPHSRCFAMWLLPRPRQLLPWLRCADCAHGVMTSNGASIGTQCELFAEDACV